VIKTSANCPFCESSYINNEGNVIFTMKEGKIPLKCPSCDKLFPGHWEGNIETGKLVIDPNFIPD
jgi:hypothetical protein